MPDGQVSPHCLTPDCESLPTPSWPYGLLSVMPRSSCGAKSQREAAEAGRGASPPRLVVAFPAAEIAALPRVRQREVGRRGPASCVSVSSVCLGALGLPG